MNWQMNNETVWKNWLFIRKWGGRPKMTMLCLTQCCRWPAAERAGKTCKSGMARGKPYTAGFAKGGMMGRFCAFLRYWERIQIWRIYPLIPLVPSRQRATSAFLGAVTGSYTRNGILNASSKNLKTLEALPPNMITWQPLFSRSFTLLLFSFCWNSITVSTFQKRSKKGNLSLWAYWKLRD